MHGQLASGARCFNCVMSVHLDPFFVCTSSEDLASVCMCVHTCAHRPESSLLVHTQVCTSSVDSGQCVHLCAHMHTLARVFTARIRKEYVHMCMQVCTHVHTFFVCTSSEYSGQSVHACMHTCMGLLYRSFNNQQYLMCYPLLVSMRIAPSR